MAKKKDRDGIGGSGGSALGLALAGGIGGGVGGGLGGLPFTYLGLRSKHAPGEPQMPRKQALRIATYRNLERLSGGTMGGLAAALLLDKLSSLREGFADGLMEGDEARSASTQPLVKNAQDYYSNDDYQAFSPEIMNAVQQAQQEQKPSLAAELTLPALIAAGTVAGGVGLPWAKGKITAGWDKLKPKLPRFIGPK